MKPIILFIAILVAIATFYVGAGLAGEVADGDLKTFVPNTTAKAGDVNNNFTAVKNAVNDNHAQITNHKNDTTIHHSKYTDSEAKSAMGAKSDTNPYHHNRYTNDEAKTALAVELANRVNKAGDTMTGTLTVKDIIYSTPQVASVTYPGVAFIPLSSTYNYNKTYTSGLYMTSGSGTFVHSITVPAGATLTGIRAFVNDSSSTGYVQLRLIRSYFNTLFIVQPYPLKPRISYSPRYEVLDLLETTAVGTGGIKYLSKTIDHDLSAGANSHYYLSVYLYGSGTTVAFHSVKIDYEYITP